MVRLARPLAVQAEAEQLPFGDAEFTAVSSIVAFFFFPDALRALREMRRVLAPDGRLAIYTTSPEAKGTMAAPYPLATRGHFYTDDELRQLALEAGFSTARVTRPDESGWAQLLASQP
jgi:SAM-dependent methyltransferase